MDYQQALDIAKKYLELFKPYCRRIEIAGSIRREKADVGDIELVAIPDTIEIPKDLFTTKFMRHEQFIRLVNSLEKVRGDALGKYTQRILPEGIMLDLFMATEDNWGYILAIRTGSADYSRKVLARRWVEKGYHGMNGNLCKHGVPVPVKEEADLFKMLDIPYIHPRERNL